jgi:hypothetical protein
MCVTCQAGMEDMEFCTEEQQRRCSQLAERTVRGIGDECWGSWLGAARHVLLASALHPPHLAAVLVLLESP